MTIRHIGYQTAIDRLHRLRRHLLLDILSHWVFQGMIYTDRTERSFKLFLDALLTAVIGQGLRARLPSHQAWPLAFVLAHTLNFLFNGQLSVLVKNHGLQRTSYEQLHAYLMHLRQRTANEPAIRRVVIVGSVSALRWTPGSNLDVRLVRMPGFINGLRAVLFVLLERTYALLHWFPLDIYLLDSDASLRQHLKNNHTEADLLDDESLK